MLLIPLLQFNARWKLHTYLLCFCTIIFKAYELKRTGGVIALVSFAYVPIFALCSNDDPVEEASNFIAYAIIKNHQRSMDFLHFYFKSIFFDCASQVRNIWRLVLETQLPHFVSLVLLNYRSVAFLGASYSSLASYLHQSSTVHCFWVWQLFVQEIRFLLLAWDASNGLAEFYLYDITRRISTFSNPGFCFLHIEILFANITLLQRSLSLYDKNLNSLMPHANSLMYSVVFQKPIFKNTCNSHALLKSNLCLDPGISSASVFFFTSVEPIQLKGQYWDMLVYLQGAKDFSPTRSHISLPSATVFRELPSSPFLVLAQAFVMLRICGIFVTLLRKVALAVVNISLPSYGNGHREQWGYPSVQSLVLLVVKPLVDLVCSYCVKQLLYYFSRGPPGGILEYWSYLDNWYPYGILVQVYCQLQLNSCLPRGCTVQTNFMRFRCIELTIQHPESSTGTTKKAFLQRNNKEHSLTEAQQFYRRCQVFSIFLAALCYISGLSPSFSESSYSITPYSVDYPSFHLAECMVHTEQLWCHKQPNSVDFVCPCNDIQDTSGVQIF